jgi:hypothetical protein
MFNEKEYQRAYMRTYRAKNQDRIKEKSRAYSKRYYTSHKVSCNRASLDARLKRNFGVTLAERDALIQAQGGKCTLCERVFNPLDRACIDHDHITGRMRGIICTSCNKALGLFKDSIPALTKALAYLQGL